MNSSLRKIREYRKEKTIAIVVLSVAIAVICVVAFLFHNIGDERTFVGLLICAGFVAFIFIPYLNARFKKR